jgi:hypothetical protein
LRATFTKDGKVEDIKFIEAKPPRFASSEVIAKLTNKAIDRKANQV